MVPVRMGGSDCCLLTATLESFYFLGGCLLRGTVRGTLYFEVILLLLFTLYASDCCQVFLSKI
jgi:hypothetical protein